MAKLIYILLLCLLPILLAVYLFPIEKERLYASLELDCTNRGVWMYDRLYNNDTPIDLAFIGSSHTINGVSEQYIQQSAQCDQLSIVNLGYCRMGRNMSYVLLKELLANKQVKSIVLEVREDEDRYSHPVFPFLAGTADVLGASLLFNRDFMADNWDHFAYRCQLIQEKIFANSIATVTQKTNYGFMANTDTLSRVEAKEIRTREEQNNFKQSNLSLSFYGKYPKSYLKKISDLCKEQGISLFFLYLPQFGTQEATPGYTEHYKAMGEILLPPNSLLANRDNWYDRDHLNVGGANQLSSWLGNRLDCGGSFSTRTMH